MSNPDKEGHKYVSQEVVNVLAYRPVIVKTTKSIFCAVCLCDGKASEFIVR